MAFDELEEKALGNNDAVTEAFNKIAALLNHQQPNLSLDYQMAVLALCGYSRIISHRIVELERRIEILNDAVDGLTRVDE